jgi:hypothetical protein
MITKYVKFDYFHVTCRPVGAPATVRDVPFDLRTILHKLGNLDLQQRTTAYKQEKARLERFTYDMNTRFWDMYFTRLRDFNLPSRAKEDQPAEPIDLDDDEYIGENVSAIYDEDYHILMVQRNRYSLGPAAIEEYINAFRDDPNEEINFRPIHLPDPKGKVRSAQFHRKLRIKFADINKASIEGRGKSLSKWLSMFKEYDSVNAELIISVGRHRNASLGGNLRDFMEELQNNKDVVSKAEMSIKRSELTEIEVVDLFEEHVHDIGYFTVPPRTVLNHEAVVYQMAELYRKRRAEIVGYLAQND